MRAILLTRNKIALVSDEDYPYLSQFKWFALKAKEGRFYACRGIRKGKKVKIISMHREVAGVGDNKITIRHISPDTLDNRRFNLRVASSPINIIHEPVSNFI